MNLDYLDYKKRNRILISINNDSLKNANIIKMLSSYVGGLIVNEEDIKKYEEQELISLTELTYTPIFIQKSRFLYRLDKKISKVIKSKNIKLLSKKIDEKKHADAAIVYSPLTLQWDKHSKLNLPIFLDVKDPTIFDKYFKTEEFRKECCGFVLHYSDIENDFTIIDTLKKYF